MPPATMPAGASPSAGDVNGDGFDDIIVGAPLGDDGGTDAGEAYVIFGKAGGFANIDLATLAPADGFIIQGDAAGDEAGTSVSSAGDINGDGFDDLIVGAPFGDDGGDDAGEAYVIFGSAAGSADFPFDFDLGTDINPASGATIIGALPRRPRPASASPRPATSTATASTTSSSARLAAASMATARPMSSSAAPSGIADIDLAALHRPTASGSRATCLPSLAGSASPRPATSTATALTTSSSARRRRWRYDGGGLCHLRQGGRLRQHRPHRLAPADGFAIQRNLRRIRHAGSSVSSAGDVNGDGFDDLIVGAP